MIDNKLSLLAEGAYTWSKTINNASAYNFSTNTTEPITYSTKNTAYRIGTGIAFFLNEHTSLELLANYQKSKSKNDQDPNFVVMLDNKQSYVFLSVGFKIYLPAK